MTTVSKEQFSKLIGGYGFETFEEGALSEFEAGLPNMITKSLGQSGGRVSMPGEYFGTGTTHYANSPNGPILSQVTDTVARPELTQTFPVPHYGGSSVNEVIDELYEKSLKSFRQSGGGNKLRLKKEQKDTSKHFFRVMIENIFENIRKVAKKTNLLKANQVKRVMKKN
jgi:hypothetical protein